MKNNSLPLCRHRSVSFTPDKWICKSEKLIVPAGLVTSDTCISLCPFVDHEQETLLFDIMPASGTPPGAVNGHRYSARGNPISVAPKPAQMSIAMITAPRPVNTVEHSIAQLRLAGFGQTIHLFAEPAASVAPLPGRKIAYNRRVLGLWGNWKHAAECMLAQTDSPFILICEDDILLSQCASLALQHAIETLPAEHWGYASLYTPKHNLQNGPNNEGWQAIELGSDAWGALAYCFTRQSLQQLLASDRVGRFTGSQGTDTIVSESLNELGRKTYFHVPSLAEHSGKGVSSVGHRALADSAAIGFSPDYRGYRADFTTSLPGKLAVVTSYFNPVGYRAIRSNYDRFAAGMKKQGADLWTVEVAFGSDPFELPADERLLQVRTSDVLWQKERALNLLIDSLPREYDKVAWVDADLIFNNQHWGEDTSNALERYPVVQCFSDAANLDARGTPSHNVRVSAARSVIENCPDKKDFGISHPGFAWAARRDLLQRHGLFDQHVTGGGDGMMALAFYSWWDQWVLSKLNRGMLSSIQRWGLRVWPDIQGQVGYIPGRIHHMYHGTRENRKYVERLEYLTANNYEPSKDIAIGDDGLYRWTSDKPAMHEAVRSYFYQRREDG